MTNNTDKGPEHILKSLGYGEQDIASLIASIDATKDTFITVGSVNEGKSSPIPEWAQKTKANI